MTRGSGSPLPQSADSAQRPMLVIGGCDPGRIALFPKSSPLYKCMGVEHLCGCQHGLFLHKSYTHIVLTSWSWQLWLRSPRWQPCPQFCYQGSPLQTRQTGHGQDDKCATASQGPHVHFPVELLHACLCQDSELRMTLRNDGVMSTCLRVPLAGPLCLTQGPNPVLIAAWLTIRPPESRISHEAREPGFATLFTTTPSAKKNH